MFVLTPSVCNAANTQPNILDQNAMNPLHQSGPPPSPKLNNPPLGHRLAVPTAYIEVCTRACLYHAALVLLEVTLALRAS